MVIFSDSKLALRVIDRGLSTDISNIQPLINQLLTSYGIDITFQWIPGYIVITGNERADKLAKAGATMTQTSTNATLNTCKQILRNNYKTEWLNQWANAKTGRTHSTHINEQARQNPQTLNELTKVLSFS
jgi:hypothetical protein